MTTKLGAPPFCLWIPCIIGGLNAADESITTSSLSWSMAPRQVRNDFIPMVEGSPITPKMEHQMDHEVEIRVTLGAPLLQNNPLTPTIINVAI